MPDTARTADEIGLKTRHVLIDTSVYRRFGFNLRSRLFKEFMAIAISHQLRIHLDPVTTREIDRGLAEVAAKVVAQHKQYIRAQNNWNSRYGKPEVLEPMTLGSMVERARGEFDRTLKIVGTTWHGLGDQTVGQALEHYFARKAPFEREGSREFPDYFILRAAQHQAASLGGMYVISQDRAMLLATAEFPDLHPVAGLEDFLSIIASLKDTGIDGVIQKFMADDSVTDNVAVAFAKALAVEDLTYEGDRFEELNIDSFELETIDTLTDFVVISQNGTTVVLSGEIYGEGRVEASTIVWHDQGPDEPPYETRESFAFNGRTMARVILSFDRETFEDIELEITQPAVYVTDVRYGRRAPV